MTHDRPTHHGIFILKPITKFYLNLLQKKNIIQVFPGNLENGRVLMVYILIKL
jgi:hypothetical protein